MIPENGYPRRQDIGRLDAQDRCAQQIGRAIGQRLRAEALRDRARATWRRLGRSWPVIAGRVVVWDERP